MNIDHLEGQRNPGLDPAGAGDAILQLLAELPDAYGAFLTLTDGMALSSGGLLYGSDIISERNATYEVAKCLPDHIAIGDDGGGRMIFLRKQKLSPVLRADMGALGTAQAAEIAGSFESWVEQGCPFETSHDQLEDDPPSTTHVYLDVLPGGSLASLITIKNELGLDMSMAALKTLTRNLPARLLENVPYGKFRVRCTALNKRFGACLSLRSR